MIAIAPSPVTLHAVPKESIAIYVAIMKAIIGSLKPSMLCNTPIAAMIAPPGTPGAATIVIASINMKPMKCTMFTGVFEMNITARANAVIFIMEPAKWIVAQRGITKLATESDTPFVLACLNETGIVAAEEEVPRAVKYAGSIFLRATKGLMLLSNNAAMQYCNISKNMCSTNTSCLLYTSPSPRD